MRWRHSLQQVTKRVAAACPARQGWRHHVCERVVSVSGCGAVSWARESAVALDESCRSGCHWASRRACDPALCPSTGSESLPPTPQAGTPRRTPRSVVNNHQVDRRPAAQKMACRKCHPYFTYESRESVEIVRVMYSRLPASPVEDGRRELARHVPLLVSGLQKERSHFSRESARWRRQVASPEGAPAWPVPPLPQSLDRDSLWIVTDLEVFGRDGGEAKIWRSQIKVRFPEDLIRLLF